MGSLFIKWWISSLLSLRRKALHQRFGRGCPACNEKIDPIGSKVLLKMRGHWVNKRTMKKGVNKSTSVNCFGEKLDQL